MGIMLVIGFIKAEDRSNQTYSH